MLQFYPTSDDQIQLITSIAQKAGFGGGIVVDYPNSKKARKVFLCLFVGGGGGGQQQQLPQGLEMEDERVPFERRREKEKKRDRSGKRKTVKDRDWILKKKEVSSSVFRRCLTLNSFCLVALSSERQGGCPSRLEIHWAEAQAYFLIFCPLSTQIDSTCGRVDTIYQLSVMSVYR